MWWSYSARAWCGIFAHLPNGRAIVRYELSWITTTPERAAKQLNELLKAKTIDLSYLVAQPEIFPKKGEHGETVSETFSNLGLPMWRGHDNSAAGYQRLRSWLDVVDGAPMLTIETWGARAAALLQVAAGVPVVARLGADWDAWIATTTCR